MRSRALLLLAGGMLLFAAGCATAAAEPTEAPTAVPTEAPPEEPTEEETDAVAPTAAVSEQDATATVDPVVASEVMSDVVDSTYIEKEISVPVGTTITWIADATLPHTVTSDDDLFNSGTMGDGDTFSFTFTEPGTYAYYCRFHGGPGGRGMAGVITVTEG